MHRTKSGATSRFTARSGSRFTARTAASACATVLCILGAQPGMAGESVFATQLSSPHAASRSGDLRVSATRPTIASADIGGFVHRTGVVASPMPAERPIADHTGEADRGSPRGASIADGITSSTIVEPVSIAVLGFTAAALIAVRRRKNAETEAGPAAQRIS